MFCNIHGLQSESFYIMLYLLHTIVNHNQYKFMANYKIARLIEEFYSEVSKNVHLLCMMHSMIPPYS